MKTCILCGSKKFKRLHKIKNIFIDECLSCHLVVSHGKTNISYKNYHRDEDYQKFEKMFRNIFLKRYLILNSLSDVKPGRILDIGCSTGTFLGLFKKQGFEVWGVEPSKSGEEAGKKGIKVISSTFEKAELPDNYFDVVILNHTLEHVRNPVNVLEKVRIILKKGGLVFVDVPNFGGLSSRIFGRYWRFLTPEEHIFHFTNHSLRKILEKAGFKIIHQESRSGLLEYGDPLAELWDALTSLKKRFFTDILTIPYCLISSASNMGDSMSFIAKKE